MTSLQDPGGQAAPESGFLPTRACLTSAIGLLLSILLLPGWALTQENADCLACHEDKELTLQRGGRTISVYVDEKKLGASMHADLDCVSCHVDLEGVELPHEGTVERVDCGLCHDSEQEQHAKSLHGKAIARGDPLAPRCSTCHGTHDVQETKSHDSPVSPLKIPFLCGRCHQEGSPVQTSRVIHQDHILENYSESIHGEGLLKKGLIVAPTCVSCHTSHSILPHTDPSSSISRGKIASTCTQCHAEIEAVHRKVIKGELWEKKEHVLPACVDCHQPHKIRKVFYEQGMADEDCLTLPRAQGPQGRQDGRSLFVDKDELAHSRHAKTSCSQCHSDVNASLRRPCETIVGPGRLLGLPRRDRPRVRGEHPRHAASRGRPERPDLQGVPRHPRHAGQARSQLAHLPDQRPDAVRALPPRGREGSRSLSRALSTTSSSTTRRASTARGC